MARTPKGVAPKLYRNAEPFSVFGAGAIPAANEKGDGHRSHFAAS
jgi:hypothetical protein